MDTLLKNGDHAPGPDGRPVTIAGGQALLQRVVNRLRVRKGCFGADPGLGSELYRLPLTLNGEARDRLALHYAQQALLPEGVRVENAVCRPIPAQPDSLAVDLVLRFGETSFPLEVAV